MRFDKWQGLGNDFIVVNQPVDAALAQTWCDRRFGIGGDGVLVVTGSETSGFAMHVINADGSRPEMCGNGLRCVVGHLAGKLERATGELAIATDAGTKRCVFRRDEGGAYSVRVEMGQARVEEPFVFEHESRSWSLSPVDMGNPHAVSFDAHEDRELDQLGPALERARAGGVNVELCRVRQDGGIDVIVWERGVGRTLACGTGACAVAAAACRSRGFAYDAPTAVWLPGGPLEITVRASGEVIMEGPAQRVFTGEL
jgi:diaminopimelate epimerase